MYPKQYSTTPPDSYLNDDQIEEIFHHDFRLNILNEKNIYITKKYVELVLSKYSLNHKVKDLELFQTAVTHISYLNITKLTEKTVKLLKDVPPIENPDDAIPLAMDKEHTYGRLEYLGDAVIHHVIAKYLYERYPTEGEGFLTKLRTNLEKSHALANLSRKIKLIDYAVIARNIELSGGREKDHLAEDIFEAFVGALSCETSYDDYSKFIINIIESEIDIADIISNDDNYKDQLMRHFHKLKWEVPKYNDEEVDLENKIFTISVKNPDGKIIGIATSNTKSNASKLAAMKALKYLGILEDEHKEDDEIYGEIIDDNDEIFGELES
jgi:ribonuclease-3